MIKPDGVQRGLVGEVIKRFETKGFHLKGMKIMNVSREHAETHYSDLAGMYVSAKAHVLSFSVLASSLRFKISCDWMPSARL